MVVTHWPPLEASPRSIYTVDNSDIVNIVNSVYVSVSNCTSSIIYLVVGVNVPGVLPHKVTSSQPRNLVDT